MNEKLYARREAMSSRMERREERRGRRVVNIRPDAVDPVGARSHFVPAHNCHHPRVHQVVRFQEAAAESGRTARDESGWQGQTGRQQILVASVQELPKEIESAIVEAEVAAHPVEGLASGNYSWRAGCVLAREALHRTTVEVKRSEI